MLETFIPKLITDLNLQNTDLKSQIPGTYAIPLEGNLIINVSENPQGLVFKCSLATGTSSFGISASSCFSFGAISGICSSFRASSAFISACSFSFCSSCDFCSSIFSSIFSCFSRGVFGMASSCLSSEVNRKIPSPSFRTSPSFKRICPLTSWSFLISLTSCRLKVLSLH